MINKQDVFDILEREEEDIIAQLAGYRGSTDEEARELLEGQAFIYREEAFEKQIAAEFCRVRSIYLHVANLSEV